MGSGNLNTSQPHPAVLVCGQTGGSLTETAVEALVRE